MRRGIPSSSAMDEMVPKHNTDPGQRAILYWKVMAIELAWINDTPPTWRAMWGTDIPRVHWKSKRPHERPKGPIIRKAIPSWAWEGTIGKARRRKAGLVQARMAHNVERATTTEIRLSRAGAPMQRNQARIGRQNHRKIGSNSSLPFRYI
jgi:hypothetical protein